MSSHIYAPHSGETEAQNHRDCGHSTVLGQAQFTNGAQVCPNISNKAGVQGLEFLGLMA